MPNPCGWFKHCSLHRLSKEHLHRCVAVNLIEVQDTGRSNEGCGCRQTEILESRQTAGTMNCTPFKSVVWTRSREKKQPEKKKLICCMHVDARLPARLSEICRLSVHVWPYINSAYPALSCSCCSSGIDLTTLWTCLPPFCSFPFSFTCYIDHTSGISCFPLNLYISLRWNKLVGTIDSNHPLGWVAGYSWLRSECGLVDHLGFGREGCQKDNIPENRLDYMAQPIKLPC